VARRRYVYYRVGAADADAALAAIGAFLASLRLRHPSLRTELLRRSDADGSATLMEIYEGVDDDVAAVMDADAAAVLAPWQTGPRRVEVFETVDD
jgi:hypothetical protein